MTWLVLLKSGENLNGFYMLRNKVIQSVHLILKLHFTILCARERWWIESRPRQAILSETNFGESVCYLCMAGGFNFGVIPYRLEILTLIQYTSF